MIGKFLSASIVILLLHSFGYAQSDTIRVTHATNLRSAPNLESAVLAIAPPGAMLTVGGGSLRWLRVNWQGIEAWMADWVAYTRVEENVKPRTQPDASIDNCCFIGWHCASDDEWRSGYHAYQSDQCQHPGIVLEGSPGFILQMEQALDLLQSLSPKWYQYVIEGLDRIRQAPAGFMGVHVAGRHLELNYGDQPPPDRDIYAHTLFTGTVFIHEACHVYRYEAGLEAGGLEGERACVETELAALLEYAPDSPDLQLYRRVLANIDRPECQWWWGEYRTCFD